MSSKKKKNTVNWVKCDGCEIILSDRDVAVHENDCPPFDTKLTCPFVLNGLLHCSASVLPRNDVVFKNLPQEEVASLVFLSVSALQLCNIPIGDPVIIETGFGKYVRKAWKAHERPQLTAAFSEQDLVLAGTDLVKISKLTNFVKIAKEILIEFDEDCMEKDKIVNHVRQMNKNKILAVGNRIDFSYFGKLVKLKIIGAEFIDTEVDGEFFLAVAETFWTFGAKDVGEIEENEVAGLETVKKILNEIFVKAIDCEKNSRVLKTRGILIYGPNGTGKTSLMKKFAKKWAKTVINVSAITDNKEEYLNQCFSKAELISPSVITIDDIDTICSPKNQQIASIIAAIFEKIHKSRAKILILATTSKINDVNLSLRRSGRFDKEIEIPVPNPQERFEILKMLTEKNLIDEEDLKSVAFNTHGFVGADLCSLVSKAINCDGNFGKNLLKCLPLVRPSAMKEIMIQVPNVRWEDIGGQHELKHQLKQAVEWPLKYPESFKRLGVNPPRGVLMYGPPGCSKTMIAKALATESGLNFISVKGPELFNKWVGESEKAVREVFRRARQAAPSIVFFDELDALAGERSSTSGGPQVQERVLAQLLTELDGVEALGHVVVVGATNRPDRIDPALLRPGRLDRVVFVPLPDYETRCEIFKIRFIKTKTDSDVTIEELAEKTEGYSGAEVVAVCNEAALSALDEDINIQYVSKRHFLKALSIILPRTCENYKRF